MTVDAFSGVRVVELAQWVFVPVAGSLLADWGADVIKIEHAVTGDGYRGLSSQGITSVVGGVNQSLELANRGKQSIGLDVTTDEGRELAYELIATADVFLTNFLPSTIRRLGFDVDDVRRHNPRLIYARGHGFGVRGPDADKPAYDATAFWARGGLGATLTPSETAYPIGQRGAFGDRIGAVHLAFGVAGALYRRERTGEPSVVDVSLLATAMWVLGSDVLGALQGRTVESHPRMTVSNPLVNTFRTADGRHIALVFLQPDRYWTDLCRAIGRPDLATDARFVDMTARAHHRQECLDILDKEFASQPFAHWCSEFSVERFPWAPFQTVPELLDDPQVVANGYIGDLTSDGGTSFRLPTGAVQFDECPPTLRRAPEHAQDTETLLLALGRDWDEIIRLKEAGVIS